MNDTDKTTTDNITDDATREAAGDANDTLPDAPHDAHDDNSTPTSQTETPSMSDEQTRVREAAEAPDVDIEALEEQISELKQEVETNLQGWQRSRAEFTNYKRRTQKELTEARERGALDALSQILPVIDDFERALDNIPDDLEDHPWVSGTSLILKKFDKVLENYNVEEVDPVGEEFDPNYHEAVMREDSDDYESGIVTATLQKGYKSGERVLRPALVRVAS
jgi:molecular chaperone GrpE